MARIKIDMPPNIIYCISIAVRIGDINYGKHLGNDSLVGILHEARVSWLMRNGFTEFNAAGPGLIMSDLAVEYLNESFYGDLLSISIAAGEISKVGFELFYLLQTSREQKTIIIAKGKTAMVCYDYAKRKVVPVPAALKEILAG